MTVFSVEYKLFDPPLIQRGFHKRANVGRAEEEIQGGEKNTSKLYDI